MTEKRKLDLVRMIGNFRNSLDELSAIHEEEEAYMEELIEDTHEYEDTEELIDELDEAVSHLEDLIDSLEEALDIVV